MKQIGGGGAYVLAPIFNAKRALLRPSRGHLASAVCLFFFRGGLDSDQGSQVSEFSSE